MTLQNNQSGNFRKLLQEYLDKANPRRKLIAKIDEQIQLAANKYYTPTQHKCVTD